MGQGRIVLPENEDQRLGTLIGLFRSLTESEEAGWQFAHRFVSLDRNLDANIADLVDQYFEQFVRDLRRQMQRSEAAIEEPTVPASDRVVFLNHNEQPYQELVEALTEMEMALVGANDYEDLEDKEQRIAEISAGQRLLAAPRVRLEALLATIGEALIYLAKKFMDSAIGQAASWAINKMIKLAPAAWTFFTGG